MREPRSFPPTSRRLIAPDGATLCALTRENGSAVQVVLDELREHRHVIDAAAISPAIAAASDRSPPVALPALLATVFRRAADAHQPPSLRERLRVNRR
jgi:hypothetical protein